MSIFRFNIKFFFNKKFNTWLTTTILLSICLIATSIIYFFNTYENKFYQGIYVDNIYIGGLSKAEALTKLNKEAIRDHNLELKLTVDDIKIASSSSALGQKTQYQETLAEVFELERAGFPLTRLVGIIELLFRPQNFSSKITYQHSQVEEMVLELKKKVDILGREAQATLKTSGSAQSIVVDPGEAGRELIISETTDKIYKKLDSLENDLKEGVTIIGAVQVEAKVASTSSPLTQAEVENALDRASIFVSKSANFQNYEVKDVRLLLNDQELVSLLNFPTKISQNRLTALLDYWEERTNRNPTDAVFSYNPETLEVYEFKAHRDGLTLDKEKTQAQIISLINQIEEAYANKKDKEELKQENSFDLNLNLKAKKPNQPLAATNNLGINELIGFGDSHYAHSIPTRIYNVAHTTDTLSLTIIKPGDEFSFNKSLGEVSTKTGYKPAYVIKNGMTELAAGGGVCQVSTTLFRAVLDAGLEVSKRKAHSYRVSYYELDKKPGFDATVYSGDTDLRFINDTGKHILIYGETDSENVYMKMELYGTSDGRTTEIKDYRMWGYQGPPAAVYIPDPSLPKGKIKQIDWAASGIKAEFTNVVKDKDGNILHEDYYYSYFRPWSAKYLQGV